MIFSTKFLQASGKKKEAGATICNFGSGCTTLADGILVLTLCIVELVGNTPRHFLAEKLHPTLCEIPAHIYYVRGASKIKLKNVNKKRMATARRLIFFEFLKASIADLIIIFF
jgi:hypothetical protein